MSFKGFEFRAYPDAEQIELIQQHFDACRLVQNLAIQIERYAWGRNRSYVQYHDLAGQLIKLKQECQWLKNVNSQSLQSALRHVDDAYKRLFKGLARHPKFKSKYDPQSFTCPQNVTIKGNRLWLPKFKTAIKIIAHRKIIGIIKTVTFRVTATGKYFVSVIAETPNMPIQQKPITKATAVGIDVGIKNLAVLSDGTVFNNPKHLSKLEKRLAMEQRRLARKKRGSKNRVKQKNKVAKVHEKIANQRKDNLHKVSDAITKQYDTIIMEDLNIAGMVKNHKLAKSISDVGLGTFKQMIIYKAAYRGNNFIEIGRFEPSSKKCSRCGYINHVLTLSDRKWTCPNCGVELERDLNAAVNIRDIGLAILLKDREYNPGVERTDEPVELSALAGTVKQEKFLRIL